MAESLYRIEAVTAGSVPTPPTGKKYLFLDSADLIWKARNDAGALEFIDRDVAGAVDSVFGRTGVVVAQSGDYDASEVTNAFDKTEDDTDDITEGATNLFMDTSEQTKLGYITITQAVNLDTMESDVATNNDKVTNATHTGEVTGSGALTLDPTAITNKPSATVSGSDTVLISDADDSGNLKEVTAQSIADLASGVATFNTFGTGGEYTNLGAAITAGKTNLLQVGDSTETANITLTSDVYINTGIYNLDMVSYSISASGYKIKIVGTGKLTYARSGTELISILNNGVLEVEGITIDNNSTASGSALTTIGVGARVSLRSVRVELPDYSDCLLSGILGECTLSDITIDGGGTGCYQAIFVGAASTMQINNIVLTGTFSTTAGQYIIDNSGAHIQVSNLIYNANAGGLLSVRGEWDNIKEGSATFVMDVIGDYNKITNVTAEGSSIDVGANSYNQFVNIDVDSIDMTDASASSNKFTNCLIATGFTVGGDWNDFVQVAVGNFPTGGGADTVTFSAGGDNNTIAISQVDAAISDSGTGNSQVSIKVY